MNEVSNLLIAHEISRLSLSGAMSIHDAYEKWRKLRMNELFEKIYTSLLHNKELVIATIISDKGSTPRTSGSRMIIYSDGTISGTIGGGAVEADAITHALKLFAIGGATIVSYDLVENGNSAGMDLICGGRLQVLIEHMVPSEENCRSLSTLNNNLQNGHPVCWVGKMYDSQGITRIERAILSSSDQWVGAIEPSQLLKEVIEFGVCQGNATTRKEIEGAHYFFEPLLPPETVYLIGGGHVSKEIAVLAKQVGFRTVIVDDREEFANTARFPTADEVYVSENFKGVFETFSINTKSYIIIVTRGHHFDKEVLAQALGSEAGYIGMIGSRRKKDTIYKALVDQGIGVEQLNRVHCPIGLSIAAETPAEIGVSVVAQLIEHRAGKRGHG